jgi:hypothetical protein
MAVARPFAYNTGSTITGTDQIGDIAIGVDELNYPGGVGGVQWWNGPNETLGYIITKAVPDGSQPNPLNIPAYVGFYRSKELTESSFVTLVNGVFKQTFTTGAQCSTYLNNNGYWTSWGNLFFTPTPTPTPTITPTASLNNTPIPTITPTRTLTPTPTNTPFSVDPNAQAFITAAGITDPTQQSAINSLVVGLKATGIWTKMIAIYPFVGGTASSHKYNLKDPRDLDIAYRLTFGGGWGHTSNGIVGNGANTYADTYIFNYNLGQIGVYTNSGSNSYYGGRYGLDYDYGTLNMFPYIGAVIETSYAVSYFSNTTDGSDVMVTFDNYPLGFTTIAGGDGTAKFYYNGTLMVDIIPSANPSPLPISLWFGSPHLGYNMANPSYDFYSNATLAFGFVTSSTLNLSENSDLNTLVQSFEITLGRNA